MKKKYLDNRQTIVVLHSKVEGEDAEQIGQDWKEDVNIDLKYDKYSDKLIKMMIGLSPC